MTRWNLLSVAFAALCICACGLPMEGEARHIPVLVNDVPAALKGSGALFEVRYCTTAEGDSFLVSELRTELDAQGMHWHSGYDFRYELSTDVNHDHRFGPGDTLTVSTGAFSLGQDEAGTTFRVSLYHSQDMGLDQKLAEADWLAK